MDDISDRGGGPERPGREPLGAMTLYPRPESVPQARRWFLKFLTPHNLVRPLDDCLLMLSELVTNAVLHGDADTSWRVRVEWWRRNSDLGVDVHSPGLPTSVRMRRADADESNGRGLYLVDVLADSWHVGASRYGGTVVSFTVAGAWASSPPDRPGAPGRTAAPERTGLADGPGRSHGPGHGNSGPGPEPMTPSFHDSGEQLL
ncbi:ATP-binding protein [Streptomyces sp. 549]|uniref:ATP-binding protein n=1 Tax=Streptomyces sp. 549 TaxID=3049076 RepID=UPI0032E3670A